MLPIIPGRGELSSVVSIYGLWPSAPPGDMRTLRVDGDRLQGRGDDQIEILKGDGAHQDLVAESTNAPPKEWRLPKESCTGPT
jgi:hypothetical protein